MTKGYLMSAEELRRHMEELEITAPQLANMLGMQDHGVRRYTMGGEGNRKVPPSLALLIRLLKLHPEQVEEIRDIAAGRFRAKRAAASKEEKETGE